MKSYKQFVNDVNPNQDDLDEGIISRIGRVLVSKRGRAALGGLGAGTALQNAQKSPKDRDPKQGDWFTVATGLGAAVPKAGWFSLGLHAKDWWNRMNKPERERKETN